MVAASPEPDKKMAIPGWDSKIYLIRFSSPNFKPQIMSKRVNFCSIGSGAGVNKFQRYIRDKLKSGIFDRTLQAEVMNPGGWAKTLAFSLFHMIDKYPQDGISKHLHLLTVRRGVLTENSMNYKTHLSDGTIIDNTMPKVARSYDEMMTILKNESINGSCAVC